MGESLTRGDDDSPYAAHKKIDRVRIDHMMRSVSQSLGDDFRHRVRVDERLDPWVARFVATVEAHYARRELADESESVPVPLGPWDHVKFGLNGLLDGLDRRLDRLGIVPVGRRFRVRTRVQTVKRVYHVCPHRSSGIADHVEWLVCRAEPGQGRADFRHAHYLLGAVEQGLVDPAAGRAALAEVRRVLREMLTPGRVP